ncbi:MAG: glycosyltransferase [Rhodothalassiaceae bacterium]
MIWLSLASLAAILCLMLSRHGFWRADQRLGDPPEPRDWPDVAVIVPARNEADTIQACLHSLAGQDYPGVMRTILVDDGSDDGTAQRAQAVPGVTVLTAPPLAPGWSGKLAALQHGVEHAQHDGAPPFFWFTDADIVHGPGTVRTLVAKALAEDRALVSLMVRLATRSFWEKLLVPAFIFFFQKLYPFPAVNNRQVATAAAAGGCVLVRAEALAAAGGLAAIRGALIDDCALAALIKQHGHGIWLGLAEHSRSLRRYRSLRAFWIMVRRTAFTQLDYRWSLVAATVAAMAVLYGVPLAAAIVAVARLAAGTGGVEICGLLAPLAALAGVYAPTVRYHHLPLAWSLSLPIAAVLYTAMTVESAMAYARGTGGAWKGRVYSKSR